MRTTFHLAGDFDLLIDTNSTMKGVVVSIMNPLTGLGMDPVPVPRPGEHCGNTMVLTKSAARAIASALMGAAAEA